MQMDFEKSAKMPEQFAVGGCKSFLYCSSYQPVKMSNNFGTLVDLCTGWHHSFSFLSKSFLFSFPSSAFLFLLILCDGPLPLPLLPFASFCYAKLAELTINSTARDKSTASPWQPASHKEWPQRLCMHAQCNKLYVGTFQVVNNRLSQTPGRVCVCAGAANKQQRKIKAVRISLLLAECVCQSTLQRVSVL